MEHVSEGLLPESDRVEPTTRPRRIGQVPRDIILIVLGAVLAFAGEEWRDARHSRARVTAALTSIRDELRANSVLIAKARETHLFLADTLAKLASRHLRPSEQIYSNGMYHPANVTNTAWQAARETGVLADIPLDVVLSIAPVYEAQQRYRALADAIGADVLNDARRDGMEAVFQTHFAQFIPLEIDAGNREMVLLDHYRVALERLAGII